ncbi:MAG: hypothetical protein ACM3S0_07525 [Acidobacteriota bacterium]
MKILGLIRPGVWILLLLAGTACSQFAAPAATPFVLPTPLPRASFTATAAPTSTVAPTSVLPTAPATLVAPQPTTGAPAPSAKRITFQPGSTSAVLQGNLPTNGIDTYALRALAGQTLTVKVSSAQSSIIFSVNGVDGDVLKSMGAGASSWSGTLRTTQDYVITVSTPTGVPANYTLQVTIPPLAATAVPSTPKRITFQPGATSATVQGTTATPGHDRFVLRALAGQTMTVKVSSTPGDVIVIIYGADGNVLISDHAGATSWTGQLPTTQDYMIDTRSIGSAAVNFTLTVTIPPK